MKLSFFQSLFIVQIMIIIWIYHVYLKHPKLEFKCFNDIKNNIKTGDLILFHGLDNIAPIGIGCYYGHMGIVFIDPESNNSYLFEAYNDKTMPFNAIHNPPYNYTNNKGITLCDLKHRIESYRGYVFYKELESEYIIDKKIIRNFRTFIDYCFCNLYYEYNVINNGLKKYITNETLHSGTNCAELTYLSLVKLGLLSQDKITKNRKYHLKWLCNFKQSRDINNNLTCKYKTPVYLLSNYFNA